ncbi:MAG: 50S ribosomal protein L5 [Candidatus Omnitrophota bacterium]
MEEVKEKYTPRFMELYRDNIVPELKKKFGYKNHLAVPRILKIVVNMGVGGTTSDAKIMDKAAQELSMITGQKAKICRSRKAISNFKLREGLPIGCCVTLRRKRMYEFLDRFITVAAPRIRDFRGLPSNSFDGQGNYTFGLSEQGIFPEIDVDRISRTQGMNITLNTNAKTDGEAKELLKMFGFPFRKSADKY